MQITRQDFCLGVTCFTSSGMRPHLGGTGSAGPSLALLISPLCYSQTSCSPKPTGPHQPAPSTETQTTNGSSCQQAQCFQRICVYQKLSLSSQNRCQSQQNLMAAIQSEGIEFDIRGKNKKASLAISLLSVSTTALVEGR